MTPRTLAVIGVRLLALIAVIFGISLLSSGIREVALQRIRSTTLGSVFLQMRASEWLIVLGPFFVLCSVGFFLWLFSDALAYSMTGRSSYQEQPLETAITPRDLLTVMLVATGIYLIATSIPSLLQTMGYYVLPLFSPQSSISAPALYYMVQGLSSGTSLGFGLILVFGARRIAASMPIVRQGAPSPPMATLRNLGRDPEHRIEPESDSDTL